MREIVTEMKTLGGGDTEIAHSRADELLCEALRALANCAPLYEMRLADDLIGLWEDMEKWYA